MSRKKITIDKLFSDRLKILIEKRLCVTQKTFSTKVGISQGYLSMVLKGVRGASAELIAGLYIHYGNYLSWLLTGDGEITINPEKETCVAEETPIYKGEILEDAEKRLKKMERELEILKSMFADLAVENAELKKRLNEKDCPGEKIAAAGK